MTDWKIIFALCYSEIPNREADTKTDIELYIQFETKDFTLFHIVASSIFSQISKLNFDYCCNFDMFYYSTFLIHRNGPMDLITYRWVLFKIYDLFEIIRKMVRGEEIFSLDFATQINCFLVCPNIEWKLAQKWVMIRFSRASKDPSFHITFQTYNFLL